MRYIRKTEKCQEFEEYIAAAQPTRWDVPGDIKLKLHLHLWREQQGLCIYCQQGIPEKKQREYPRSHIEHIRPKGLAQYAHLAFCHANLSVACEGFDCRRASERPPQEFCEHRKGDAYDEARFLNPVGLAEIESYFEYDNKGNIYPNSSKSAFEQKQAEYMIELLELQHEALKDMRRENYQMLLEQELNGADILKMLDPEQTELLPFYSMLKQFFALEGGEPS